MTNSIDHVHFIHVPKTGGTAIKWAVKQYTNLLLTTGGKCKITCHRHNVSFADISVGEKIFFTVRDPIDRFVSAFFYCKRKTVERRIWFASMARYLSSFDTPCELAACLEDNNPKFYLAKRALEEIPHMRTLSRWYVSKDYFNSRLDDIFFIGFFKTFLLFLIQKIEFYTQNKNSCNTYSKD